MGTVETGRSVLDHVQLVGAGYAVDVRVLVSPFGPGIPEVAGATGAIVADDD